LNFCCFPIDSRRLWKSEFLEMNCAALSSPLVRTGAFRFPVVLVGRFGSTGRIDRVGFAPSESPL
jgi:hypothetical protein